MNKFSPALLFCLAAMTTPVLAVTADQKVTAVTVYPDRALVTRSGTVQLQAGVQTVVFENLPLNLEEDSVRARAQGKLKILGVEVRQDYKEAAVNPATQQLQEDVTKLDDQVQVLNDEKVNITRRQDFLDKMRDKVTSPSSGGNGKDPSEAVQTMQGFFELYGTETAKNSTRWNEINILLRDLGKQHDDKTNQLSLLQQPAAPNTRSALVTVEAADGGPADLQVSYLEGGAGWQPQYDAYADPKTQKVELTYYGVVRQTTGEDWKDVALTLSSARPSTAARLPELGVWTVDFIGTINNEISLDEDKAAARQQSLPNGFTANNSVQLNLGGLANSPAPADSSAPDSAKDAPMQTAEVRSLGPAASFVVPARASIPSDNQPHRSAISVLSLDGQWAYVATPRLVPGAFLKARVTNTSGGPLLGGDINAFLGNDFIGKSYINLVAANASFDLYLGVDENIKITRTEGVPKEEIGGILTRLKLYKRSFTIELQNFKTDAATFKLRDQLPVSKNGKIAVVVNQAEPAFTARDQDTGEVTWEFKLDPNEKKTITVDYEVDAPYDQPVAGL